MSEETGIEFEYVDVQYAHAKQLEAFASQIADLLAEGYEPIGGVTQDSAKCYLQFFRCDYTYEEVEEEEPEVVPAPRSAKSDSVAVEIADSGETATDEESEAGDASGDSAPEPDSDSDSQ